MDLGRVGIGVICGTGKKVCFVDDAEENASSSLRSNFIETLLKVDLVE